MLHIIFKKILYVVLKVLFQQAKNKWRLVTRKLAEDYCKHGTENQSSRSPFARAAFQFGTSHESMENERETMLGMLGSQWTCQRQYKNTCVVPRYAPDMFVSEPLRALITGAPLEDAHHLTHRYDRLRQEVETQILFDFTFGWLSHKDLFFKLAMKKGIRHIQLFNRPIEMKSNTKEDYDSWLLGYGAKGSVSRRVVTKPDLADLAVLLRAFVKVPWCRRETQVEKKYSVDVYTLKQSDFLFHRFDRSSHNSEVFLLFCLVDCCTYHHLYTGLEIENLLYFEKRNYERKIDQNTADYDEMKLMM
ncbi:hypothetical protein HYC85_029097 [Camellia sinensis]|uniref:Uncharacterized protein n=1 Tax=Camellia sinensis TaxID=4442 RepID=A0A7J7G113_CAMSI|nr:hypothetical protein HYC85_029097 [Camellia sinensis]